jgi:hypothetical protein
MASNFAGGSAVRLSILLCLLAALGGTFAYDHFVTMPKIKAKIEEFQNLTLGAIERPEMTLEEREKFEKMTEEEQEAYEKTIDVAALIKESREKRMNDPAFSKESVRIKVALTPIETREIGDYEVEHYRLSRTLPFMPGGAEIFSVYRKDRYLGYETKMPTQRDLDKRFNLSDGTDKKVDKDNLPVPKAG